MPKHILFIFTDQQRRDTIRALGNENIQTPSLDAIANTSTVYENAITPSPVCVPARLSMYAGQYPARTGCNNNYKDLAYKGDGFYSELTRAGWQTCAVGKMHHSSDPYSLMGFTKRYTQEEMSHPDDDYTKYIKENYPYVFDYNGQRSEFYYVPQVSQLPAEAHPTQWVGDRSIDFLDEADPEKNVFLMASFIQPPPPFCPPAPWNKLYR
ncbi:MAG: sulfatase-like hydrolase/transferase, partial [Clostridia bacterium]|nr:sulfatase-like hydrolase/transferase [Clostridia bacterium]